MRTFMAGAKRIFLSVASNVVLAKSLASPCAALAIRSAVAGTTTTRSALRESSMWPISDSLDKLNKSVCTFCPLSAATDRGVTNCSPLLVIIACVLMPRLASRRIKSKDLNAAIPPPIMSKMLLSVIT